MMEDIMKTCLICGSSQCDEGFESLFVNETETLSNSGNMYEELLGLKIDVSLKDFYPTSLCPGCDLQLKIFYDVKMNAYTTLEKLKTLYESKAKEEYFLNDLNDGEQSYEEKNLEDYIEDVSKESQELQPLSESVKASYSIVDKDENDNLNELSNDSFENAGYESFSEEKSSEIDENINIVNSLSPPHKYLKANISDEMQQNIFEAERQTPNSDTILRSNYKMRQYVCSKCGKKLKNLDGLKAHMNSVHLGLAPYQCEICTTTFWQKAHLTYHLAKHNNKRDFKCKVCDKGFLANGDLKTHMRFHNSERPFQCNTCGKTYTVKQHLRMHEFSHHKDSNFIICRICHRSFSTPATLRTHIKTIHSEPQFHCSLCNKSFRRKHHLIVHQKTHAAIDPTLAEETIDDISNESFSSNGFYILADTENCDSTSDNQNVIIKEAEQNISFQSAEYVQQLEQTSSEQLIYDDQQYIRNELSDDFIIISQ